MQYESTRGKVKGKSFVDVLLSGYADDGGFLMPEVVPQVTNEELYRLSTLSYVELCTEIVKKYVSDEEFRTLNLSALIGKAFRIFSCEEIVPVKCLGEFFVAELWHGNTLAFKDLAVSCLNSFTDDYLKKHDLHVNVICATSGDTGSSIMQNVKGSSFIDVFTLFPEGRCSEIQERQLVCIDDTNVHAYSTQGTSDDFDVVMEMIFDDKEFSKEHNVVSFSSANWIRILIQTVHYFFSYFKAVKQIGDFVSVVIPSGGLGNLTAGYVSRLMGLPIELVAAVNQNDTFHKILTKGDYKESKEVLRSSSCSMDIMVPYNFERILYLATNRDETTARLMEEFKQKKSTKIPLAVTNKIQQTIQSASVSEVDVSETIKNIWDKYAYHVEPHTAVAAAVVLNPEKYGITFSGKQIICLSCASPQKFPEIFEQVGVPLEQDDEIKALLLKEKRFKSLKKGEDWVADWVAALKTDIKSATERFGSNKKCE